MTIIVAVDLSPVSAQTLDVVRRIFPREGLRVYVVHVSEPDPDFVGWDVGPDVVRDQMAQQFRRERQEVEQLAASLREAGIDATGLTIQGPTVDAVIAEAAKLGADLLAVGSHGHGAAYDLAVGSVSAGIIRKAQTPVLVVPARS
jgi:nucleotide-binding universal stress UspA family protein